MIKRIQNLFWLAIGIGCVVYVIYVCVRRFERDHIKKEDTRYAKAVMINKRHYNANTPHEFIGYSYEFNINRIRYTGIYHDTTAMVGDTVKILYDVNDPALNKPADINK